LPGLAGAIGELEQLLPADGFRPLVITPAHGLRAGAYSQASRRLRRRWNGSRQSR
jgi:hypothetical protein